MLMLIFYRCFWSPDSLPELYIKFGKALNDTEKQIVYSCSWPSYQLDAHIAPDYALAAKTCNLWRYYQDIQDSWDSVMDIIG